MNPKYQLTFTKSATKMFMKLPAEARDQIIQKLDFYLSAENPLIFAKKLVGIGSKWRWKSGDYRIIFEKKADGSMVCLMVLKVGHRKNIYD